MSSGKSLSRPTSRCILFDGENISFDASLVIYMVSQEECEILRESVPYVKLYRYNPKHLYPKLNGYGDNGQRKVWTSCISDIYMSIFRSLLYRLFTAACGVQHYVLWLWSYGAGV